MKRLALMVMAATLMLAFTTKAVMAQEKAKMEKAKAAPAEEKMKAEKAKMGTVKVLLENDKVKVYEADIPVGAEAANIARPYRIGRALTNGTIQRIFADGKKETAQWKAGEVKELGPQTQYIPRNIGKTDFRIYVVEPKSK